MHEPRLGLREAGFYGCGYLVLQLGLAAASALLLSVLYGLTHPSAAAFDRWTKDVLEPLASVAADIGAGLFLILSLRRRHFLGLVGWRRCSVTELLAGACLGLALGLLGGAMVVGLESRGVEPSGPGRLTPGGLGVTLSWTLIVVALAPWSEETLFRGVLFTGLAQRWGIRLGGGLCTLAFVLAHHDELVSYPAGVVPITALGLAALGLRLRTGSLGPAVALHLAYNTVIAVGALTG